MVRGKRLLALLLAAVLLCTAALPALAADPAEPAAEASTAAGSISATLRIDYAQKLSKLQTKNLTAALHHGGKVVATASLTTPGTKENVTVGLRDADGGELLGDGWPGYIDVSFGNLPKGDYVLKFTGDGYRTFEQAVSLTTASQHVTLGTGDGTFTLGDVNGNGKTDADDRDAVAEQLGKTDAACDLNGDGTVNIIDLAYVARIAGAADGTLGTAEVRSTVLLADGLTVLQAEQAENGTKVQSGQLSDLFRDGGAEVRFASDDRNIVIPVELNTATALSAVEIATPGERQGSVLVEYDDGTVEEETFDNTAPAGVYAIGRDGASQVVTIALNNRVAVKKITITVFKNSLNEYVAVESIRFLQDIVPETPVAANSMVRNLRATPGSGQVTLDWDQLPNVTGYTVAYAPVDQEQNQRELRAGTNSAVVSGLDNILEYVFTVTPTADSWAGRPASVRATPLPNKAPDRPDMVTVAEMDGALRIGWKQGKDATHYKVYYAGPDGNYQQYGGNVAGTSWTIADLENGVTYSVYVVACNHIGESAKSNIHQGTPYKETFERPEGIPTEGVLDYQDPERVWLHMASNVSPTSYPTVKFQPEFMYDGDFSTHWTSHSYGDGNWWNNKTVYCTFKEPQDIASVIWVPRLDGGYRSNLRVYTVSVWLEGDDLNQAGRVVAPAGAESVPGVAEWLPVQNNPKVTGFAVLPIEPMHNVVKMAITIEQVGYTAVSLSELMFLEYDPAHSLPGEIDALFADDLHTRLAAGVTQDAIAALQKRLASDEKNYYLHQEVMADELKLAGELLAGGETDGVLTSGFTARSNAADAAKYHQSGSELQPLGAAARAGDEITVYAEGIPDGAKVTVSASQFHAEASVWRADMGTLQNGKNILTVPKIGSESSGRGGSLYLTCTAAGAENIRLHIRRATDIPMLELSDWYDLTEAARRERIGAYLDELQAYPAQAGINAANAQTNCLNVTEISLPTVLLSLPAQAALTGSGYAAGQNNRAAAVEVLYNSVLTWEDLMHICKTTQGIDGTYAASDMTSRQNIRCMQMFSGAFMYAAGNHVGIGYGSCAGMVRGTPIAKLPSGATANSLFGWGIAHEIGHNMDKLGKAEITNNIYAIMVQTYDGDQGTLPSRLEKSGKYAAAFQKTAQGYPGASNDVFVQLAMYWQLHLAYDDGDPLAFYNAFFKAWKAGTYTQGASSYDDKVALTAAGVAGKDLTEFFTRWGMTLSESTQAALSRCAEEPRAVWYLSDQSRRDRLTGKAAASGTIAASLRKEGDTQVVLTMDRSGVSGTLQGFEILRNGKSIGFTTGDTYTDTIGVGNHRTYTYTVRAYDTLGNLTAQAEAGEVRIAYDATVPESAYTMARNGTAVTFTLTRKTAVSGIKLTGQVPQSGAFTVSVNEKTALTGDFAQNQAVDDQSSFVAYLRKPGAADTDTRIWTYDAESVTVTGVPEGADVQLIAYAGDDIALWEDGFAGRLAEDYVYGDRPDDKIAAGTLVVVGTYRGDPVYNGVRVEGRFTTTALDENGDPVTTETVRPMDGYALLFAEIPADGAVSDISDGLFIFVPDVQREAELQGEDPSSCTGENLLPSELRAVLFRTDDPEDTASKRDTAETLWFSAPGGDELPVIVLEGESS